MTTQHPPEVKAAVMAALLAGQSLGEIAREYNLPKSTLSRWKAEGVTVPLDGTQKKEIGDLVLDYLRANLETLRVQAEHFRDKRWLSKQSAESVAVLHGVMADKSIRLMEAMSRESGQ